MTSPSSGVRGSQEGRHGQLWPFHGAPNPPPGVLPPHFADKALQLTSPMEDPGHLPQAGWPVLEAMPFYSQGWLLRFPYPALAVHAPPLPHHAKMSCV